VTWVIFLAIFSQRDHRVAFHGKRPNSVSMALRYQSPPVNNHALGDWQAHNGPAPNGADAFGGYSLLASMRWLRAGGDLLRHGDVDQSADRRVMERRRQGRGTAR
jgi:hypothetical protein